MEKCKNLYQKLADKEEEYIENEHGIREKQSKNIKYRSLETMKQKKSYCLQMCQCLTEKKKNT